MKDISEFTLEDIKEIDRALYETIDSIMHASVSSNFQNGMYVASKFTIDQQTYLASFLENKLNNNEAFRLKYYQVAKYLFCNRSGYITLILHFLKISTYRCSRNMPRTSDKHAFLTFLNSFDFETKKIKQIDDSIWVEVNKMTEKTSMKTIIEVCEKYYQQFEELFRK